MTDVTNVEDIAVTGQRREPGKAFPGFGSNDPDAPVLIGDHNDPSAPPTEPDFNPCADPRTALEWNADAAASEAAKEFAQQAAAAGEDGLNYRERGAFIIQRPDDSVGIGPIFQSDPFGPDGDNSNVRVVLTYEGINPAWIIGSVHSHPAGSHRPSGARADGTRGDLDHFAGIQSVMTASGRDTKVARIYIVAQNQRGANEEPYNQINVYNETNIRASQDDFAEGPEVNPDGKPCL